MSSVNAEHAATIGIVHLYFMFFSSTPIILLYLHVMEDMDDTEFNVIFSKDFDDNYENIMNCVVEHIIVATNMFW
jgi:hypothetical protein